VIGRAEDRQPRSLAGLTLHSREAVPGGMSAGSGPVGPDDPPAGALGPAYSQEWKRMGGGQAGALADDDHVPGHVPVPPGMASVTSPVTARAGPGGSARIPESELA
jgi:hypothetical protein